MAGTKKKEELQQEDFVTHGDGFAVVKLSRSMNVGGVPVESLKMREPTVRDQLAVDSAKGSDLEKEIGFFANLCEITPEQVKALTVRDYRRLVVAFTGFTD